MADSSPLRARLAALEAQFVARNPLSRAAAERARRGLPGGTTRSVLDATPFPLAVRRASGAVLTSLDGHDYLDFVSDFSAALFGHSEPRLRDALVAAADDRGFSLGAVTDLEARLSEAILHRFPSIDLVRFCNSGTEANTYAIAAALAFVGREKVLVFDNAYHGGTLSFGSRDNPMNLPHKFVFGVYNDIAKTRDALDSAGSGGDGVGVILVEPMQSAGGMRPADPAFLSFLRSAADASGAVLIFDEVVTSRLDFGGLQRVHGVRPDLTTLGKYLGGGLPFGAFGGARPIMAQFDPSSSSSGTDKAKKALTHSGTFNNNVFTMSAAVAASELVTSEKLERINALGDRARRGIGDAVAGSVLEGRIVATGLGSCVGIHFRGATDADSDLLRELFYFHHLLRGLWLGRRGFLAFNLAHGDEHVDRLLESVRQFVREYGEEKA